MTKRKRGSSTNKTNLRPNSSHHQEWAFEISQYTNTDLILSYFDSMKRCDDIDKERKEKQEKEYKKLDFLIFGNDDNDDRDIDSEEDRIRAKNILLEWERLKKKKKNQNHDQSKKNHPNCNHNATKKTFDKCNNSTPNNNNNESQINNKRRKIISTKKTTKNNNNDIDKNDSSQMKTPSRVFPSSNNVIDLLQESDSDDDSSNDEIIPFRSNKNIKQQQIDTDDSSNDEKSSRSNNKQSNSKQQPPVDIIEILSSDDESDHGEEVLLNETESKETSRVVHNKIEDTYHPDFESSANHDKEIYRLTIPSEKNDQYQDKSSPTSVLSHPSNSIGKSHNDLNDDNGEIYSVQISPDPGKGLGFVFIPKSHDETIGAYIDSIDRETSTKIHGNIKLGDRLVSINDKSVMKMDFERIMYLLNEMKHKPSFTLSFFHAIDKSNALVPTSLQSKYSTIGSNRVTIDDSSKEIDARNDEDIARRTKESSKDKAGQNDKLIAAIKKRHPSHIKPNKRKGANQDESEYIVSKKIRISGIIANGSNTSMKQSQPTMSVWCNNLNLGFVFENSPYGSKEKEIHITAFHHTAQRSDLGSWLKDLNIGFCFEVTQNDQKTKIAKKRLRLPFDSNVEALWDYKRQYGHLNVTKKENKSLNDWISNVRVSFKRIQSGKPPLIKLTEERLKKLAFIGFDFKCDGQVNKDATNTVYKRNERQGSIAPTMDTWIKRLGLGFENANMGSNSMPDWLKQLDIGFLFVENRMSHYEKAFHFYIDKLKAYKAQHGHINVSKYDDKSLHAWISNVKSSYHRIENGKSPLIKLTEERLMILEGLGFSFLRKRRSAQTYPSTYQAADSIGSSVKISEIKQTNLKKKDF